MLASEAQATLGGLAGVLELVLDHATIDEIVKDLSTTIDDLAAQASALAQVGDSALGSSTAGSFVHGHTTLAYEAVQDALNSLNAGMQHYITALTDLRADSGEADDASADAAKNLRTAVGFTDVAGGSSGSQPPTNGDR